SPDKYGPHTRVVRHLERTWSTCDIRYEEPCKPIDPIYAQKVIRLPGFEIYGADKTGLSSVILPTGSVATKTRENIDPLQQV
ncbi:hypothetical protein SERLA73DRAFT_191907, partial [Serpula lacrymans var. lacrymans S7.3]